MFKVYAKKGLGQCFLVNPSLLSHIADACIEAGEVVEIGPGTGNLTIELLKRGLRVFGVEKDSTLEPYLMELKQKYANFDYVIADALSLDYVPSKTYIGNLPYNVGSRILLRCIAKKVKQMVFLLQREVVDRICAVPGVAGYGSLSVLCQAYYECRAGLIIGPKNFRPVPKVDSRLVICTSRECSADFAKLSELLRICFHSPRKQMWNNLGKVMVSNVIDMNKRPSEVTIPEYLELLTEFSKLV